MPGSFIEDDIVTMFASSEFGEADGSIVFKGTPIAGIFDDEDIEAVMGEGVTEIIAQPMITALESDFAGLDYDDPVTVRGETFKVSNWKRDGTGQIDVFLKRV